VTSRRNIPTLPIFSHLQTPGHRQIPPVAHPNANLKSEEPIRPTALPSDPPAPPLSPHTPLLPSGLAPSPARPLSRYRRKTLELGSSCTFTGACPTGMLNVTPPSPVCTHFVTAFPCPN